VLVYSDSPHWKAHIETQVLPRVASRVVTVNWSSRAAWRNSKPLEVQMFEHWGGIARVQSDGDRRASAREGSDHSLLACIREFSKMASRRSLSRFRPALFGAVDAANNRMKLTRVLASAPARHGGGHYRCSPFGDAPGPRRLTQCSQTLVLEQR